MSALAFGCEPSAPNAGDSGPPELPPSDEWDPEDDAWGGPQEPDANDGGPEDIEELDGGPDLPDDDRKTVVAKPVPDANEAMGEAHVLQVFVEDTEGLAGLQVESALGTSPIGNAAREVYELPVVKGAVNLLAVTDANAQLVYFGLNTGGAEATPALGARSTAVALVLTHPLLSSLLAHDSASALVAAIGQESAVLALASAIKQSVMSRGAQWETDPNVTALLPAAVKAAVQAAARELGPIVTLQHRIEPNATQSGLTVSFHLDDDGFAIDEPAEVGIVVRNEFPRFVDVRMGTTCGVPGDKGPTELFNDGTMSSCRRDSVNTERNVAHDCVVSICEVQGEVHATTVDAYGCGFRNWQDEAMPPTVLTGMIEIVLPTVSALIGEQPARECSWKDELPTPSVLVSVAEFMAKDSKLINLAAAGEFAALFAGLVTTALEDAAGNLALCYGNRIAAKLLKKLAARVFKKAIPVINVISAIEDFVDASAPFSDAAVALLACAGSSAHEHWDLSAPDFRVQVFAHAGRSDDSIVLPCGAGNAADCVLNLEASAGGPTSVQFELECSANGEYYPCPVASFTFPGSTSTSTYSPHTGVTTAISKAGPVFATTVVRSAEGLERLLPISMVLANCDQDSDGDKDVYCDPQASVCVVGKGCKALNCDSDADGSADVYCDPAVDLCVQGAGCQGLNCDSDGDGAKDVRCNFDIQGCVVGSGCTDYSLTTVDYDGNVVAVYKPGDTVSLANRIFASFGLMLGGQPVKVHNEQYNLQSTSQGFSVNYPYNSQDVVVEDYVHSIWDATHSQRVRFPIKLIVKNDAYRFFAGRTLTFRQRDHSGAPATSASKVKLNPNFTATYTFSDGSIWQSEGSFSWSPSTLNQFQGVTDCASFGPNPPAGEIDGAVYLGFVGAYGPEWALLKDGVAYANSFYACQWVFPM